jgi:single-strand DNA-binding protein
MSSDAIVTIQGWVGTEPQTYPAGDGSVTRFRVAHTPRRFKRSTGEWLDGESQWFGVSAWRQLGTHCQRSVHKGDPVLVHGRLSQRTYTNRDGMQVTSLELEAFAVGHDLNLGITSFNRTIGAVQPRPEPTRDEPREDDYPPSWSVPGEDRTGVEPEPRSEEPAA